MVRLFSQKKARSTATGGRWSGRQEAAARGRAEGPRGSGNLRGSRGGDFGTSRGPGAVGIGGRS